MDILKDYLPSNNKQNKARFSNQQEFTWTKDYMMVV